jgi:hypothetical protein
MTDIVPLLKKTGYYGMRDGEWHPSKDKRIQLVICECDVVEAVEGLKKDIVMGTHKKQPSQKVIIGMIKRWFGK